MRRGTGEVISKELIDKYTENSDESILKQRI